MINNNLYKLSDFQKQIFSICHQHPDTYAYNIPAAIEIKGEINYHLLLEVLRIVQDHHPELKIRITNSGGEYLQFIGEPISINRRHATQQDIDFKLVAESQIPIICEDSALTRIMIWEIDPNHCIVQFTISHIIADRSSLSILIGAVWNIYNKLILSAPIENNTNPSFLQSLTTANMPAQNSYLANLNQLTITDYIPLDFSRAEKFDFNGDWIEGVICEDIYQAIKAYARQNKTRSYVFFASILSTFDLPRLQ